MKTGIPGPEGSLTKWQWSDVNQALTELAMDIRGPEAPATNSEWVYRFLRARANSIEGGTTEILQQHRGRARARAAEDEVRRRVNFDLTDDQQAIKSTAHDFLAARMKPEKLRELAEAGEYDDGLWGEMAELGWPGIFIGEEHGGQDLGVVELVILMEELGYSLAPSPFFSNAAAGLVIQHAGSDEQKERLLPGVASGEKRGTVGLVSRGVAALVPDADSADFVVLVDGDSASVVEPAEARARRHDRLHPALLADRGRRRRRGAWRATRAPRWALPRSRSRPSSWASRSGRWRWPWSTRRTASSSAARSGPTRPCRTSARRCCSRSRARALTSLYAAWAADHEPESLPLAASMAKAYASDAGWRVTAASLQVHGGIGFTWEHDLHFFLKRAKTDGHLFGDARHHRDQVAELAGLARSATASV